MQMRWVAGVILSAALLGVMPAALPAAEGPTTATSQPAAKTPAAGDKAPALVLSTIDGKQVDLAEAVKAGPVVVVQLRGWVGYQCPLCNAQVNGLVGRAKDFAAKSTKVILVYPGPAEGLQKHAEEFVAGKGLPESFSFVLDPDEKMATAWGLLWKKKAETAYPATFVIDKEGVVRFAKVSTTHGGRASADEILKAVSALK